MDFQQLTQVSPIQGKHVTHCSTTLTPLKIELLKNYKNVNIKKYVNIPKDTQNNRAAIIIATVIKFLLYFFIKKIDITIVILLYLFKENVYYKFGICIFSSPLSEYIYNS